MFGSTPGLHTGWAAAPSRHVLTDRADHDGSGYDIILRCSDRVRGNEYGRRDAQSLPQLLQLLSMPSRVFPLDAGR